MKKIFFLFFISINVFAQNNQEILLKKFSITELKEDYSILRNALEEYHPGLYSYTSKDSFDLYFNQNYNLIDKELNLLKFYQLLCPLIDKIGCEHTGIHLPKEFMDNYKLKAKLFPFSLAVIGNTAFVTKNNSTDTLIKAGAEVLSINSVPIASIIQKIIVSGSRSDGYIMTGKYRAISTDFPYYYYVFINQPDSFKIEILENGYKHIINTPALDRQAQRKNYSVGKSSVNENRPIKFYCCKDSSYAYVKIQTFNKSKLKKQKLRFENFVKDSFKEIKNMNIKYLIIDLRSNFGGQGSYAQYLYSYIADSSFIFYKSQQAKTNKKPSFRNYIVDKPFFGRLTKLHAKQTDTGFYVVNKFVFKIYKPVKDKFKGNVFILVNGSTGSAAAMFAAYAQSEKRANIIGEETNSAYMGGNSGDGITLKLPNSKIEIKIPYAKVNMNVTPKEKGRGIIPDYQIARSKESILNHKDETLEKAFELILKR